MMIVSIPNKKQKLYKAIYVLCFGLMLNNHLLAQEVNQDSLKYYYHVIDSIDFDDTENLRWGDLWFSEVDVPPMRIDSIPPERLIVRKLTSSCLPKYMKYYLKVWLIAENQAINGHSVYASLENKEGVAIYSHELGFEGNHTVITRNYVFRKDFDRLKITTLKWIKNVLEHGYQQTQEQGLHPMPEGWTWQFFE